MKVRFIETTDVDGLGVVRIGAEPDLDGALANRYVAARCAVPIGATGGVTTMTPGPVEVQVTGTATTEGASNATPFPTEPDLDGALAGGEGPHDPPASPADPQPAPFTCDAETCDRRGPFSTAAALASHRRAKHPVTNPK